MSEREEVLIKAKEVFLKLDLPWTNEDFEALSLSELQYELDKATPLLDDKELMREVEEVRNERIRRSSSQVLTRR